MAKRKTIRATLATSVATSATFTVSYPAGTGKGDFAYGAAHELVVNQAPMKVGAGFTISFGNSAATITNTGASTWPAGADVIVTLDMAGAEYRVENVPNRAVPANVMLVNLGSPLTADPDGICASQAVTAGGSALLNGALAADGVVELDVPRCLVGGWTGAAVLTATFYDERGVLTVEQSASGTSYTGAKAAARIVSIEFSANVTAATVGTTDKLGLPVFLRDTDQILSEFQDNRRIPSGGGLVALPWEIEQTELLAPTPENLVSPVAGKVIGFRGICQAAITTGGAITAKIGTTDITGATFTLANADAAGTVYNSTAITGANTVAVGDRLQVVPAAAIDTGGQLNGVFVIQADAVLLNGAYTVGSQAQATATSGDPRGLFTPTTPCDGVTSFGFLIAVDDPNYMGTPQYGG